MNLPQKKHTRKPKTVWSRQWEYLAKSSPKDKPWDDHRSAADGVGEHLTSPGTERMLWKQGKRMEECAPALMFALSAAVDTGEIAFKLANAKFCRVRYCPVCQWRRSLMWKARFYEALPKVVEQQPTGQWIFLTLTQKNCLIGDLRSEIGEMNKAFHRLVKRKEFKGVAGWIRSLEITPGKNGPGQAHPHFHALLFVKPSYFSHDYITHAQWREAWSEAMRLDYLPDVKVQKIRVKRSEVERLGSVDAALASAVAETLKYSVKPSDMLGDREWFLEMVRQTHRVRAIAAGGLLKNALRQKDESQQDLLLGDEEKPPEPEAPTVRFDYAPEVGKYRRKRAG